MKNSVHRLNIVIFMEIDDIFQSKIFVVSDITAFLWAFAWWGWVKDTMVLAYYNWMYLRPTRFPLSILLFVFRPLRLPGHAHVSELTTLAVNYMNLQLFSTYISCFLSHVLENNEKWLQKISSRSGTISFISWNMIKMIQTFKHSKPFFCEWGRN